MLLHFKSQIVLSFCPQSLNYFDGSLLVEMSLKDKKKNFSQLLETLHILNSFISLGFGFQITILFHVHV